MAQTAPDRAQLTDIVAVRLRRVHQRPTTNRTARVDALLAAGRPITIPELMESRPGLAQSSVYRNLLVLEQAGIVHRIVTSDEFARFELAEDLTGHHHHVICTRCGSVEDVPASPALERSLHTTIDQLASETGFSVRQHRLDLVGLCRDCA